MQTDKVVLQENQTESHRREITDSCLNGQYSPAQNVPDAVRELNAKYIESHRREIIATFYVFTDSCLNGQYSPAQNVECKTISNPTVVINQIVATFYV
jgi:hypothetical protein